MSSGSWFTQSKLDDLLDAIQINQAFTGGNRKKGLRKFNAFYSRERPNFTTLQIEALLTGSSDADGYKAQSSQCAAPSCLRDELAAYQLRNPATAASLPRSLLSSPQPAVVNA